MPNLLRPFLPFVLACLLLGALAATVGADAMPEGGWTPAAPLPLPTGVYGTVQCPDDPDGFYVLGGMTTGNVAVTFFRHYDAGTDAWTALAAYPQALIGVALACDDGVIYAAGGGVLGVFTTNAFYQYDIAGDSWVMGPHLPRTVQGAGLGAWNGYLHLVGGDDAPAVPLDPETRVDRYDIAAGVWEANWGEPMPAATVANAIQAGPFLYFVGGYTADHPQNANVTLRYDMAHNSWSEGPNFTSRRAALGLSITGQYLYAAGGDANGTGAWNASAGVERLDWTAWPDGAWETVLTQLPTAVLGNTAGACTEAMAGGEVWSVGGAVSSGSYISDTLYLAAEPCFVFAYGAALAPETASGAALPGAIVSYTLTLTNTSIAPDSYSVTVDAAWPTGAPATVGPVEPGESDAFVVTATVPLDALAGETDAALVMATSMGDPLQAATATLTTTAGAVYGVALADDMAGAGYPNAVVSYHVALTNTGNTTDTFSLVAEYAWDADLPAPLTLSAGADMTVTVAVTVPAGTPAGATDTLFLVVTSQADPMVTASVELTTTAIWRELFVPIVWLLEP